MMFPILCLVLLQALNSLGIEHIENVAISRQRRGTEEVGEFKYDPDCNQLPAYKKLSATHTMCLVADVGQVVPISQELKDKIVNAHNKYRRDVKPTATNMEKMIWDDETALIATKLAKSCIYRHDDASDRMPLSLPRESGSQNIAKGQDTLMEAVNDWYDEINNFKYGIGSFNGGKTAHYTTMVQHNAVRVGCGQAVCPNKRFKNYIHYACNYIEGGTPIEYAVNTLKNPWKSGETCEDCKGKCSDKLCDCKGKVCLNHGVLNVATCECKCQKLYSGDRCEKLTCPKVFNINEQPYFCDNLTPAECKGAENNNFYDCPLKCGTCSGRRPCQDLNCKNGGNVNKVGDTCTCECIPPFTGKTCEKTDCSLPDLDYCKDKKKSDCDPDGLIYDCPRLCGICPGS